MGSKMQEFVKLKTFWWSRNSPAIFFLLLIQHSKFCQREMKSHNFDTFLQKLMTILSQEKD